MAVTEQTCVDIGYDILREVEADVTAYPLSLMQLFMESAQKTICTGLVINPLNPEMVARKGQLSFINKTAFYTNVVSTTLSSVATAGGTSITVGSTTGFLSSGALYISGQIVTYSGVTATTFTGIPATGNGSLLFAFPGGVQISAAYALPSDYSSVKNVVYNNSFKVAPKLFDDIFEDMNSVKGRGDQYNNNASTPTSNNTFTRPFYSIVDDAYLVVFNMEQSGNMIMLRYEKVPDDFDSPSDTATIDIDIYAKTTIPYLGIAEMLYNRGEESRAAQLYEFAIIKIKQMYFDYNNGSYESISGTHYKSGKGKHLNI